MNIFTHEETEPSAHTLSFIRDFARTYRVVEAEGRILSYCLN